MARVFILSVLLGLHAATSTSSIQWQMQVLSSGESESPMFQGRARARETPETIAGDSAPAMTSSPSESTKVSRLMRRNQRKPFSQSREPPPRGAQGQASAAKHLRNATSLYEARQSGSAASGIDMYVPSLIERSLEQKNMVNPEIMRTFVINLDSRPDKLRFMNFSAGFGQNAPLPCERWRAIEPFPGFEQKVSREVGSVLKNPAYKTMKATAPDRYYHTMGCYLSHLSLIKHIASIGRPGDLYMVMEDDHYFSGNLTASLPKIVSAVNDPDWHAIRLDCWDEWGRRGVATYRTDVCDQQGGCFGGTHAIIYNYDNIKRTLDHWMKAAWRDADAMFWTPLLKNYCVNMGITSGVHNLSSDIPRKLYAVFDGAKSTGACEMHADEPRI